MICPECGDEFEQTHGRQKYCTRKCGNKVLQRKQIEFRSNPFRVNGCNDFEPTIESSWFHDENERRKNRKQL